VSFADALRALADLIASGLSIREALAHWSDHVDGPLRDPVRAVAGRIALGAEPDVSLAPLGVGRDPRTLLAVVRVCGSAGGSAPRLLRDFAASIERRDEARRKAEAAAAAARASNRLLFGASPAVVVLLGSSGGPVLDVLGLGLLACGAAIGLAGMRWVEALTPRALEDDVCLRAAALVAVLLRAGADLNGALEVAARSESDGDLDRARSWVVLGRSWPIALTSTSNGGLVALGHLIRRAARTGVPVAEALEHFVVARRAHQELHFERSARAAPVRMVVPLVVCGLPAFCLIVVGPMLRSVPGV